VPSAVTDYTIVSSAISTGGEGTDNTRCQRLELLSWVYTSTATGPRLVLRGILFFQASCGFLVHLGARLYYKS
jgi:hypothetical protein